MGHKNVKEELLVFCTSVMKNQLQAPLALPEESFLYYMNLEGERIDPKSVWVW